MRWCVDAGPKFQNNGDGYGDGYGEAETYGAGPKCKTTETSTATPDSTPTAKPKSLGSEDPSYIASYISRTTLMIANVIEMYRVRWNW